ncbi:MAG: DUF2267 domain-containing protein [Anaeromyxobacteraceae bacterium]
MPTRLRPVDLEASASHGPLVEALARAGLTRRSDATRAVQAVVCALALRTRDPAWDRLRELLPSPFKERLAACERHAASRFTPATADEFEGLVADDLDRPGGEPGDVPGVIRAVFSAIRAQLGEPEAEELGNRLPVELEPYWRRAS